METDTLKAHHDAGEVAQVVYVIDDDPAILDSLSLLLEQVGVEVRVFDSGADFLEAFDPVSRCCVLLDVLMPEMTGLEILDRVHATHPWVPVIMITGHGDAKTAVSAMKRGALDFFTKPFPGPLLIERLNQALRQSERQRERDQERVWFRRTFEHLSDREREVLELMVEGKSIKEIGHSLSISPKTVEKHRTALLRRFDARNAIDLVRITLTNRLS